MKKTLIALAVAASAAVSGSAMAWSPGGYNGSVALGGVVDVLQPQSPWQVQVGNGVNNLNIQINPGESKATIPLTAGIPVLGIRTESNKPFHGQTGISPQINFSDAVDLDSFKNGRAVLTLDVNNESGMKIGPLTTTFTAGAEASVVADANTRSKFNLYAAGQGEAFYGGLPKSVNNITQESWYIAKLFGEDYVENYNDQGGNPVKPGNHEFFNNPNFTYSAFYAAGILDNAVISITLDRPATSAINWKASLPVQVSYQ
ncbi:hypothetical protein [Escherichia coli]|uniref:F4 family fimbrial subunit n=1 Tax=Escherichia coli TaxID=562 RepID=UPI0002CAAC4E|nr:hypothetical protein [Escherichia coli]ENC27237.1 fimbrial, major and minor subunit [Escherichia coli P02997067.6]ENC87300.1 fimbrial, major and minor subunit [Escherichia coli P0299917.9]